MKNEGLGEKFMKEKNIIEENFLQGEILSDETHKLVVAIVNSGYASASIVAARENGGEGAIILTGRGVSKTERSFFGMTVEPENEVVLMVVKERFVYPVIKAIYATVDFKSPGRGMVFALPISHVTGLSHGVKIDRNDKTDKLN